MVMTVFLDEPEIEYNAKIESKDEEYLLKM